MVSAETKNSDHALPSGRRAALVASNQSTEEMINLHLVLHVNARAVVRGEHLAALDGANHLVPHLSGNASKRDRVGQAATKTKVGRTEWLSTSGELPKHGHMLNSLGSQSYTETKQNGL